MSMEFKPMAEDRRSQIRRRVIDWARQQAALPELAISLLEGPGGLGPDLVFFTREGGSLIYLTDAVGEQMPDQYAVWLEAWQKLGAPEMSTIAVEREDEVRHVLLHSVPLYCWATAGQQVH